MGNSYTSAIVHSIMQSYWCTGLAHMLGVIPECMIGAEDASKNSPECMTGAEDASKT